MLRCSLNALSRQHDLLKRSQCRCLAPRAVTHGGLHTRARVQRPGRASDLRRRVAGVAASAAAPVSVSAPEPAQPTTAPSESLSLLKAAQPLDRFWFQAMLLFRRFDKDGDGLLNQAELLNYLGYSGRRLGLSDDLSAQLKQLSADTLARLSSGGDVADPRAFVTLVRAQAEAAGNHRDFLRSQYAAGDLGKVMGRTGLSLYQLGVIRGLFLLLDVEEKEKVSLDWLATASPIERALVVDKLIDADADDDNYVTFDEFLVTYHQEKPVFENIMIMAANTLLIYVLFHSPLELIIKVAVVAFMIWKPEVVSRPVLLFCQATKAIFAKAKAEGQVAQAQRVSPYKPS